MSEREERCDHRCMFCGQVWAHKWRDTTEAVAWCYLKKVASCTQCLKEIMEVPYYGVRQEPSVTGEQQSQYQ